MQTGRSSRAPARHAAAAGGNDSIPPAARRGARRRRVAPREHGPRELDGALEPAVGVGDHEPGPVEPAVLASGDISRSTVGLN